MRATRLGAGTPVSMGPVDSGATRPTWADWHEVRTQMSRSSIALSNLRAVVIIIVLAFHAVLAAAPGNAVLKSLLETISSRTVRARVWHGVADRQALDLARAEHTRIYEAIVAGDAELARSAALLHIETNERWLREHLGPEEDVPLDK